MWSPPAEPAAPRRRVPKIPGPAGNIDDITANPVLTIQQEFDRGGVEFTDYEGVTYRLRDEYDYVVGTARVKAGCTPGTRDAAHDGWTLHRFMSEVNQHISSRRALRLAYLTERPEEHAYLSEEEVIAVRLYTGPSYIVINDFLRQISALKGTLRQALATHPAHTFAATVSHLCSAIRKLAAVATTEEATRTLYRGVRGELERSFFSRDRLGMVVATEAAFMSTSTDRATPLHYMSAEKNVLWRLRASRESDDGYHYGADVSMLSQFAVEEEVLFPPCTMLIVKEEPKLAAARKAGDVTRAKRLESEHTHIYDAFMAKESVSEKGVAYLGIDVLPTFL